jgi:hypothetical protein
LRICVFKFKQKNIELFQKTQIFNPILAKKDMAFYPVALPIGTAWEGKVEDFQLHISSTNAELLIRDAGCGVDFHPRLLLLDCHVLLIS